MRRGSNTAYHFSPQIDSNKRYNRNNNNNTDDVIATTLPSAIHHLTSSKACTLWKSWYMTFSSGSRCESIRPANPRSSKACGQHSRFVNSQPAQKKRACISTVVVDVVLQRLQQHLDTIAQQQQHVPTKPPRSSSKSSQQETARFISRLRCTCTTTFARCSVGVTRHFRSTLSCNTDRERDRFVAYNTSGMHTC